MSGRKVVFLGPGTLRLTEGGKEFSIGDEVTMPDIQRASLARAGMRFGAVPDEPPPPESEPEPPALEPADVSKAAIGERAATTTETGAGKGAK